MHRVLKAGGVLTILEFAYPDWRPLRWFYDLYFVHLMPLIGQMLIGDRKPFLYFRESVRNFIWGEALCRKLREAGFEEVSFEPLSFSIAMNYQAKKR
jgi:demethylmenaquinone methyltransferase/2-methoxy-6-polyprenyl-1,4-benzoquinol methylase